MLSAYITMHSDCGLVTGNSARARARKSCCMSGLSLYLSLDRAQIIMASSCGLKAAIRARQAQTYALIQPAEGWYSQRAKAHRMLARPCVLSSGMQPCASAARPPSRSRSRTSRQPRECAMLVTTRGWFARSGMSVCSSDVSRGSRAPVIMRAVRQDGRCASCRYSLMVRSKAADRWMPLRRGWLCSSSSSKLLVESQPVMDSVSWEWSWRLGGSQCSSSAGGS
mmetsp:Transcript_11341/g.29539  ORF Transcript_11341/g.29539 Transcript_11341/m.29539 type:complete len:224 (+) Transcript_11341:438-1109(+)